MRLPTTMNNDPNDATMKNQFEIGTSTAVAPAIARSTNPAATTTTSTTATCFSHWLYAEVRAT